MRDVGHRKEERWRSDEGRKPHQSSNNYVTFFFFNFPTTYGEYNILNIFHKWARLKQVFISRRLNRWERRFDFVNFFEVENVGRLEKELEVDWRRSWMVYT